MSIIKSAQKRVARPMIARSGGTHMVDLATGADSVIAGMEKGSEYTDDNGETECTYHPPIDRKEARDPNRTRLSWPFGRNGGVGDVIVKETPSVQDVDYMDVADGYQTEDVQPEPSEADGENQDADGEQDDQDSKPGRSPSGNAKRAGPRYARRLSQL